MKHLFKLKKDGKTVGYLKLAKGWTQFHSIERPDGRWFYPCDFKWTTAHPFVTTDKHGKDVFADDKIKFLTPTMMRPAEGTVLWYDKLMNWIVEEKTNERWSLYSVHEIELIEESQ